MTLDQPLHWIYWGSKSWIIIQKQRIQDVVIIIIIIIIIIVYLFIFI